MQLDMLRVVDIELTNRCNATCSFCPREKTPKQGFMDYEVFCKAVERVKEFGVDTTVFLTGLGEPMLHPRFLDCVRYLKEQGLVPGFTTNASRLFKGVSEQLLDAGLKRIYFSVSDMGDDYQKVYGLDYEVTRQNIADFMSLNKGRCQIEVVIVRHDGNEDQIDEMVEYWNSLNVDRVHVNREINRGGSCRREYHFQKSDKYRARAKEVLRKAELTETCYVPFAGVFIGWNGNYYLCCSDWEKQVPLKTVFNASIHEVDELKYQFLQKPNPLCAGCSADPVNDISEVMHEVEIGKRGKFGVANRIKSLAGGHEHGNFSRALAKYKQELKAVESSEKIIASSKN